MVIKTNNPQYCGGVLVAIVDVANVADVIKVFSGPCLYVGAIMEAGAATTLLSVYDKADAPIDASRRKPGVKAAGGGYDGFTIAMEMEQGIIATLDALDGIAWIFYVPAA